MSGDRFRLLKRSQPRPALFVVYCLCAGTSVTVADSHLFKCSIHVRPFLLPGERQPETCRHEVVENESLTSSEDVNEPEEKFLMDDEDVERSLIHYDLMMRIRCFEQEIVRLHQSKDVVGSVHLCSGQEAIYVGAVTALDRSRDLVFPTYRGRGWAIASGTPLRALFAEHMGREDGLNGGRAGAAAFSDPDRGLFPENPIVGAHTNIAAGAALAAQFDGSGRVVLAAFGDGAMNQGGTHEAMNFAATYKLPVVFVLENNRYSELTPIKITTPSDELYRRADAYDMPGERIDGNDVDLVHARVTEAVSRARQGQGPSLIEAMTERIVGHYIGDIQHYRPSGEVDEATTREPIGRLRNRLSAWLSEEDLLAVDTRIFAEVAEASQSARAGAMSDPLTVEEHLYA